MAELSTLFYKLGQTAHGEIVGFEPDDDAKTGVTWEYEALSTGQARSWTRKTDLMYNKPPTRTSARTSMISWFDKLGSGQGMILFGGLGSDNKKILGDTWLYRKETIGAYWLDETENSQPLSGGPPKRHEHAMTNLGFGGFDHHIVLFGGMGESDKILGDTWMLTATAWHTVTLTWKQLHPTAKPKARWYVEYFFTFVCNPSISLLISLLTSVLTSLLTGAMTWHRSKGDNNQR